MARTRLLPRRRNLAPRRQRCRLRCDLLVRQFLVLRLCGLQSRAAFRVRRDLRLRRLLHRALRQGQRPLELHPLDLR